MTSIDTYVLDDDGKPTPCSDPMKWGRWMGTARRHVAHDQVGNVRVSTIFLGLDHSFFGGAPVLWETMVFGGALDGRQRRYTSREAALAGHAELLSKIATA